MEISVRSQITIFEMVFVFALLSFTVAFTSVANQPMNKDYKLSVDSFVDALYYSEDFRDVFMGEDLSVSSASQDWSMIQGNLSLAFLDYELIIANGSVEKKIFSCASDYNKYYAERVIAVNDSDTFEFRMLRLGVCY